MLYIIKAGLHPRQLLLKREILALRLGNFRLKLILLLAKLFHFFLQCQQMLLEFRYRWRLFVHNGAGEGQQTQTDETGKPKKTDAKEAA